MTQIHETAYPRIRSNVTEKELDEIYTPSEEDIKYSRRHTFNSISQLHFLVMLKAFQRLGYFPKIDHIDKPIIDHIANKANLNVASSHLQDNTIIRPLWKHYGLIRSYLDIKPFINEAYRILQSALITASRFKDIIADIINVGIEELVRQRYELPAFSTLHRAAKDARSTTNKHFYK